MKPPPEQHRDAREFADWLLWFVAALAVLHAIVAGVLFVMDLIWGTG
jgi:hypothetical protein